MQKDRGFRTIAVIALCLSVLGLSIGFAAVSQQLNVQGQGKIKGNVLSVEFDNLAAPTIGGTAVVATPADISTGTVMTFDVMLLAPGDKVTYLFDVVNTGTIPAKLASKNVTGIEPSLADDILCTFTYSDGSAITPGTDVLAVGASTTLKLVIEFDPLSTTLPTSDITRQLTALLVYEQ